MLLAPILSFYCFQLYAATNYPSMNFSDRSTYAGILASVSVFLVMAGYTVMAVREKI